ncbi:hypothetical protein JCM8097_000729 [Rhodosporidiobolus ruineniae]
MPPISVDDQLIPPSLLPLLHDCVHYLRPLWFAELEAIYQAVDNMATLSRDFHRQYTDFYSTLAQVDKRPWWSGLSRKKRKEDSAAPAEVDEVVLNRRVYGFFLLTQARAAYICNILELKPNPGVMFKLEDKGDSRLKLMTANLPALDLTTGERDHLATLGIFLAPTPPYAARIRLPQRPRSVTACWQLRDCIQIACQLGMPVSHALEHLGDRYGQGKEEDWQCRHSPSSFDTTTFVNTLHTLVTMKPDAVKGV